MKLNGLHDDVWAREQLTKHSDSIVFKALVCPETLTREEIEQATYALRYAEPAIRWAIANMKYDIPLMVKEVRG